MHQFASLSKSHEIVPRIVSGIYHRPELCVFYGNFEPHYAYYKEMYFDIQLTYNKKIFTLATLKTRIIN